MKTFEIDNQLGTTLEIHNISSRDGFGLNIPISGLDGPSIRLPGHNRGGEDGHIVTNSLYGERRIILTGVIWASDPTDYHRKRRQLQEVLRVERDSDNFPVKKLLKFTSMDDRNYQVEADVNEFRSDLDQIESGRFLIDFQAGLYVEYQTQEEGTAQKSAGDGGYVYPVTYPIASDAATGGNLSALNVGNANAKATVTLHGPLTTPTITNVTLDRSVTFTLTLASGDTLEIDMDKKTAIKNGTTNVMDKVGDNPKWWGIAPGTNEIRLASGSTADTGHAIVKFRSSFIGL